MLRASPKSQVAKTRILWLMGPEQCIAWCDVAREISPVSSVVKTFFSTTEDTGEPLGFCLRLLFASFRPLRHGRRLRMMTHVGPENPEDDVLGNVGSVVRDAFEITSH